MVSARHTCHLPRPLAVLSAIFVRLLIRSLRMRTGLLASSWRPYDRLGFRLGLRGNDSSAFFEDVPVPLNDCLEPALAMSVSAWALFRNRTLCQPTWLLPVGFPVHAPFLQSSAQRLNMGGAVEGILPDYRRPSLRALQKRR